MDTLVEIYTNFWAEHPDNQTYKAVYMINERLKKMKPADWFKFNKIRVKLDECSRNFSSYKFWGEGNGSDTIFIFYIYSLIKPSKSDKLFGK